MGYFTTTTQTNLDIAAAVEMREYEIANYEVSKNAISAMIAAYSNIDWDDTNSQYKNTPYSDVAKNTSLSDEDKVLIGKLQHKDTLKKQYIETENEQRKSQLALEAVISLISTEDLVAAITTYKASKTTTSE